MRSLRPLLLLVSTLLWLFAGSALQAAAPLSERSPVRMGLWWDPQHSGSGFELFRGGDEVAVIWYTYRADGSPTWYAAIARFDAQGAWQAPLIEHRWANGAHAGSIPVGELRMQRNNFEALALQWRLGAQEGTQSLVPFPISGVLPEVDHSGAWYQPSRSGYGLSLVEQGDWLGSVLYYYDGAGAPIWAVGNNGGQGTKLALQVQSGRCPGCTTGDTRRLGGGELDLRFIDETRLDARYTADAAAAWPLQNELRQVSLPASRRPADRQLAHFDDDASLRNWMAEALVGLAGHPSPEGIDFSPAPLATTFSGTNVQEVGVDEADRVKSDGRWIYSVRPREGRDDTALVRVAEVADEGAQLAVRNAFELPESTQDLEYAGLYLADRTLVALNARQPRVYFASVWASPWAWREGKTTVVLLDRADPARPALRRQYEFDAHLVASRRIGDKLYLVLRNVPSWPESNEAQTPAQLQAAIRAMPLERFLPKVRLDDGAWQPLLRAQDVHLPISGNRPPTPALVSVVAIDLVAADAPKSMAVAGGVDAVYASPQRLYLASARAATYTGSPLVPGHFFHVTDIHRIELAANGPLFTGTGAVEGYLDREVDRAPFRFSEHEGRLRVVTVSDGMWGRKGVNRLTVLEPSGSAPGLLRTVSFLPNEQRPAPLGKPGEQLYGTRFVGNTLYAVTFLKIDPLYVVDLSDAAAPRIAGEVELPGFSEYLHPVGERLLLGIGFDAVQMPEAQFAWYLGMQFALFDVADPARPRVIDQRLLGKRGSGSAAIADHHALSVLRVGSGTRFALPVRVHEPDGSEIQPAPNHYYPWSWSGLQSVEVTSDTPASARLALRPLLITHRRTPLTDDHYDDDAVQYARSIQFPRGAVYVEQGRFWLATPDGAYLSGPQ